MMKQPSINSVAVAQAELGRLSEPERIPQLRRYFRCEPGGYGEGDEFRGVRVPNVRAVARRARGFSMESVAEIMASRFHEDRLLGAILLVQKYERATSAKEKYQIRSAYLQLRRGINNWDLVDVSAPGVIGAWTCEFGSPLLGSLAASPSMWDRRIAMISTLYHIRHDAIPTAFEIADVLLDDRNDLIEKAAGWMLREAWKREPARTESFLILHYRRLSATTRRYATELMTSEQRTQIKQGKR